jgi:hypothetical protein
LEADVSRPWAAALLIVALSAGCTGDETDPTPVTEVDGVTGSTQVVDPREGGAVSTNTTAGNSATTNPQG